MAYSAYSEYKDSSSKWLGEIPNHWDIKKLKFVAIVQPSNVDKKTIEGEETVLLCNYTDVYKNEFIDSSFEFMKATATHDEIRKFAVDIGDVIVTKDSESPDDIAIPACIIEKVDGLLCGYHLTQIKPKELDGQYLFRLFQSTGFNAQFVVAANGVTRYGLPQYAISNAFTSIPPIAEQKAIARFLDHKTAQIDALIAKKESLLAKLAEKRTALISHAVTKGLDPTVPMKDSGVAWLGLIPKHWDVKPVKFIAKLGNGSTPSRENPGYWSEGYFPWLNSSVVNQDNVIEALEFVTTEALKECHLPIVIPPAILVGITGQGKTRGMATTLRIEATINQHMVYVKPTANVDVAYLRRIFDRAYFHLRNESDAGGSTKGAITCEQIANLKVSFPPVDEQVAIAEFIETKINALQLMVSGTVSAIQKLKEYRSALITNAVTGKIDVRNITIPSSGVDHA